MSRAITITGGGGFVEVGAAGASIDITFHTATGGGGGATNLAATIDASTVTVTSDTGTDATIPAATVTDAGVLSAADKATIDGLGTSASLDVGTTAGTVAAGDDARLSDARTPTAHAASHTDGGADEIALDASQVTSGVLAVGRLASGTPDGTKFVRDDGTLAVPAGGGSDAAGNVVTLAPRPSGHGWAFHVGTGTTTPPNTSVCASIPFTVSEDCTLTDLFIEVTVGAAGASHVLALYACSPSGEMGGLVTAFAGIGCTSAGIKSLSGLSAPLTAGDCYAFASLGGATPGHVLRGLSTGTTGWPINAGLKVLMTSSGEPSRRTGGDNTQRGAGWAYTPSVAGVHDAAPTWGHTGMFMYVPNIGLVFA